MSEALYWHCLHCGAHEMVEPTGGPESYELGDFEPCISCETGVAFVVTARIGAAYEQGRALGMDIEGAWARAQDLAASITEEDEKQLMADTVKKEAHRIAGVLLADYLVDIGQPYDDLQRELDEMEDRGATEAEKLAAIAHAEALQAELVKVCRKLLKVAERHHLGLRVRKFKR